MKKIAYVSYLWELVATILFVLTLNGTIASENENTMFYVIWFMGFLMSAFSGARDAPEIKKEKASPKDIFPPIICYILYAGGLIEVVILIAMFFPQLSDYRLAMIITYSLIAIKWLTVHGYKLYSSISKIDGVSK